MSIIFEIRIKILLLDGCDLVELNLKLNFDAKDGHAALSLKGGEEGIDKFNSLTF